MPQRMMFTTLPAGAVAITLKLVPGPCRRLVLVPTRAGTASAIPAESAVSAATQNATRDTFQVVLIIDVSLVVSVPWRDQPIATHRPSGARQAVLRAISGRPLT